MVIVSSALMEATVTVPEALTSAVELVTISMLDGYAPPLMPRKKFMNLDAHLWGVDVSVSTSDLSASVFIKRQIDAIITPMKKSPDRRRTGPGT
jgi:hypothetical protein